MLERVGIEKKIGGNMKDDEELEMLLDEIPQATSHNFHHHPQHKNHHVHGNGSFATQTSHGVYGMYDDDPLSHYKYTCASPVSGFSLQSDGSSSSLFSGGHSLSDNGSPTPPPLEEPKSHIPYGSSHCPNGLWLDSKIPDLPIGKKVNQSLIDELGLSRNLNRMYISDEQEDYSNFRNFAVDSNGFLFRDHSMVGTNQINVEKHGAYENFRKGFSDYGGLQSSVPRSPMGFDGEMSSALSGLQQECMAVNLLGSGFSRGRSDALFSQFDCRNSPLSAPRQTMKEQASNYCQRGIPVSNLTSSMSRLSMADALFYAQKNGMNLNEERGGLNSLNLRHLTHPRPHLSVENLPRYDLPPVNGRMRAPSNMRIPQGGLESFAGEDSIIIQEEGLNHVIKNVLNHSRGHNKDSFHDIGVGKPQEIRSQLDGRPRIAGICENDQNSMLHCSFSMPLKYNSLVETQGYIYLIAKDQHGCRFLQRMFEEGTPQDVQIIFDEIIDHVIELMINPFGNYLMQKLLDVCTEEQRMQILLMVTEEPGELVRISLNTHGTRVVQKLIETLKTRQQISLVISALEPGFLALIKDLNGNHVVQRCLQCFSNEDNKFIFVAAAKYCVDIATHQHGCCVLQRCINRSTGEYREDLVAEISTNGLLLAQDAYGNYVVQFILDLRIPSATSNLISQFEGNYVHLSTQKFSSHVVEKCPLSIW
ncbi:hypothetical protein L1049_014450 [Liquidambar formosana]|uniref:PUM-HD domain-containing protein n=1 Tax=Liquidambar formosana TaxID=63359 RepID=A0AAP0S3A7_LIQFO